MGADFHQAPVGYLRARAENQTVQLRTLCYNEMDNPISHLQEETNKNLFSSTGLSAQQRQGNESRVFVIKMCIFFRCIIIIILTLVVHLKSA